MDYEKFIAKHINMSFYAYLLTSELKKVTEDKSYLAAASYVQFHKQYLNELTPIYNQLSQFLSHKHGKAPGKVYWLDKDGKTELFAGTTVEQFAEEGCLLVLIDKTFRENANIIMSKLVGEGLEYSVTKGYSPHKGIKPKDKLRHAGRLVNMRLLNMSGEEFLELFNRVKDPSWEKMCINIVIIGNIVQIKTAESFALKDAALSFKPRHATHGAHENINKQQTSNLLEP